MGGRNIVKALELLTVLSGQNVRLWVEGDRLRYLAPKSVSVPELRDSLLRHKEELIGILRRKASEDISIHPLSHGQKALWFINRAMPESASYHVAFPARICSTVDVPALQRVFQALMDRHPMLRTTYTDRDGVPVQQVYGHMPVSFIQTDASTWTEEDLQEKVAEAYRRPFDLERGPLLRVHLFSRSEADHIFLMAAHHIAVDGWSSWLLLDEMRSLYSSEVNGEPAFLPMPEAQYTDYVRRQAEMLSGDEGERLWAYWKKQLEGELVPINLPGHRSRKPVQGSRGASHVFTIGEHLTGQIKSRAATEGVTLYTFLLSAYLVLLHRYSGQTDILVSSPVAGRSRPEYAPIVGCFVNPVVLRAAISGDMAFRQLLSKTHETILGALEHQDYPLSLLTERVQPARDRSRSPLFQVDFALQKSQRSDDISALFGTGIEIPRINFGGLELQPFYMPQQEGQLDLTLEMAEGKGLLWGSFKYGTDLFDADTADRMARHFQNLLESIVRDPAQCIGSLRMLSESERNQLLLEWSGAEQHCAEPISRGELCVHQLFEREAERTPDAPAVVFDGKRMTYRELNEKANQLAHYLRKKGVGPETLVAIYMERSPELISTVMGVLKGGGAYLPLDPMYPVERLAYMLEDSRAALLLTRSSLLGSLPAHGPRPVCLDTVANDIGQESVANPAGLATPENLVYVIYTSGSTGRAKGVMIQHSSLAHAYFAWEDAYGLRSLSSHLQMASFSFDVFAGDFVRALCSGARLVLCPRECLMEPDRLYRLIGQEGIEFAEFVPVVLRQLCHYLEQNCLRPNCLKVCACGSDNWYAGEYLSFLKHLGPETRLINSYGTTEATIDSTYYDNPAIELPHERSVPIGRPFADVLTYVLDDCLQPCPAGIPGELYIGGTGVARGYLNNPEMSAAKFIQNPFRNGPEGKLYKTGDRAGFLPDGNLELLGRIDDQIKIRGFRVEPGEIEALIKRFDGVAEAAVSARPDEGGNQRLLAYLVCKGESPVDIGRLRGYLKKNLPDYMMPSALMTIDRLPMTPSGKINRRALPDPGSRRPDYIPAPAAPANGTEETIAGIWKRVLGLTEVGTHDDFFDLGGHSLLTTQLHSRLRDAFGVNLPLRNLFEAATVAEQGRLIETLLWASQKTEANSAGASEGREEIEI
jgi:amino acid adenylation domain-containing protein